MSITLLAQDPHDDRLRATVRPPDWVNPEPAGRYNLVAVGAGAAGLVSAGGAAVLGGRAAIVERDLMGGDCLNAGCVPSKAVLKAAKVAALVRHAGDYGINVADARVDFAAVMERVRRLRADISPNDSPERFRREFGVDVFLGEGRFVAPDAVEVGGKRLRFRNAVIATGGRPAVPDVPGLAEAGYRTNENVFALTELPRRLAVVGAGPVGCELAQAFARFGSAVTLVARHGQILPREEPEAAAVVREALEADGVTVLPTASVVRAERRGGAKVLALSTGAEVEADEILVAAGRVPNVEGLGLEAAGVDSGKHGVVVDDRLRTTNPNVYAAGDVCFAHKFTHAADATARVVLANALSPVPAARASRLVVPWCTYTDPELAKVGLNEAEARDRGVAVTAFVQEFRDVDRAVLEGDAAGFVKVLVKRGTDRIVGATIVGANAGELISEVSVAMAGGVGLGKLAGVIHPYPTRAEAIRKAGDAYNRTRLTPLVEWAFGKWLAWRR